MKKFLGVLFLALLGVFALTACAAKTYEIALVTDVGNIDDKSFNEGAWNGVKEYAEANGITYAYYRPAEDSTAARVSTIENAIAKGAKVVVCPGYLFETAIYEVQDDYPNVNFLLLDGQPHTEDYSTYRTASNVHCILYQEEQAGFLAGYAAVKDGYRSLGFVGGMAVPAVVRFGYGFVQGADAAAVELGLTNVTIKYYYCGAFAGSDALETKVAGWYADGVEVVFACGGKLYTSVVAAAEATADGKVIGVDVDQVAESTEGRIITSAMKALTLSVKTSLLSLYNNGGTWSPALAGTTAVLGVEQEGVGLPTATASWKFETFTLADYNAIFNKLVTGEIVVSNDIANQPTVTKVTVDYNA